jgi:hypothetical protein
VLDASLHDIKTPTLDVNSLITTGEPGETVTLSSEAAQSLKRWVNHAYEITNRELLNILIHKYKFEGHCNSIRKYLLMAQGDFM